MLNAIIRFSIRNKLVVGLMVLGLVVWGSFEVSRLPVDAVPDITNNQVQVITVAPSLGAPDVERFITFPIEQATRNVPGIIEQRSFSRFGLSLVTIVFDDATDVYWARQQVNERVNEARQNIPAGMGDPQLGPVTTGLGEIFQYVVKTKPGYEGKYTLTELRTIQDWIVRRQLLGTPGVADVSSFGGLLKQYEVAVNPDKPKSFGITVSDLYNAIKSNNQNAGGAYIEKGPGVLFIRSEGLVNTTEDIGNILVKRLDERIPVLVRDVATVQVGNATRYGATTYNAEGEVVGAIVMMLKGENSNTVIRDIKKQIKEIETRLPEGVMIEAFLDRTKMVNHAISTVQTNLLEGALIVVFILVLFLGNLRAGLIVASVIPLSMLFAIILMNAFGVSGNLMSLGALDFGLLVDGAVIIVEAVMHRLRHNKTLAEGYRLATLEMDHEVETASKKMMNAAVFGQVIILIVYLPILTLQGIEGKMFKPMAQTVSFALLGAFFLSMTYVPMVSALFLSKKITHQQTFADRFMHWLERVYARVLVLVLAMPKKVIAISAGMFLLSVFVLSTLGGEFIPELEEGDFAVETRVLTGSSLSTTIDVTSKGAAILMEQFPEVEKVVTKIGSGEIPTDPMPLEAADMMVILKDKKLWTSASSFDELAEKMTEALQEVPGIAVGFQYPVQMRFNELMTGARQDVVCKVFGENLDSLALYAQRIGSVVNKIEGASDLFVETVTGVPQIVIHYNRGAMARFGVTVEELNRTVEAAFAGTVAGQVYEGDRRFDLVVRLQGALRKDISDVSNLLVHGASGQQVPLNVLADVKIEDGPYQVQREDAQRRIVVGFNVRGRDVQSIVKELQQKIQAQIKLSPGYYVTYGGQYENLQHATRRLMFAVPLALLLIFVMLFFALGKLKYGLLIFSAIPLSAIGGVLALWIRGMPFSISAGVGFIALFGVAVLNGIVLISEMNLLKEKGMLSIKEIIMKATRVRLRPVLMTAAVASLGFLPMALSNGAGAEVQRPLATVVIGGLITATFLTLLVLPCLYLLFEVVTKRKGGIQRSITILLLLSTTFIAHGQGEGMQVISMEQAVTLARQNNLNLKKDRLQQTYFETLPATAKDVGKTWIDVEAGQNNSAFFDTRATISQSFTPAIYKRQTAVYEAQILSSKYQVQLQEGQLVKLVRTNYNEWQYLHQKQLLLQRTDSIYKDFQRLALLRYQKGETNLLEKATVDNMVDQLHHQQQLLQADIAAIKTVLLVLMNAKVNASFSAADFELEKPVLPDSSLANTHPMVQYYRQQQKYAAAQTTLEQARLKPEFSVGYVNQSFTGWQADRSGNDKFYPATKRFSSVQVGVGVPLFAKAGKAKIKAAQANEAVANAEAAAVKASVALKITSAIQTQQKYLQSVRYYRSSALKQADVIIQNATVNYRNGAINYLEWGMLMSNAINLQSQYLDAVRDLNNSVYELQYLITQ